MALKYFKSIYFKRIFINIVIILINISKEIVMKLVKLSILAILVAVINGCASSSNAVAMNLYDPNSGEYEETSGVSVVVTQEMIDEAKANLKK